MSSNAPVDLSDLDRDELRRAVAIYLPLAYPSGAVPEAVRRRLDWPQTDEPLPRPPFERANKPGAAAIYALRLGNARYPHMKMQVQAWPIPQGYLLSVNTHDQILGLDPAAPDSEAFRALQEENARIKDAIERAWDDAGLPTFTRYLRDYLRDNPGDPAGI